MLCLRGTAGKGGTKWFSPGFISARSDCCADRRGGAPGAAQMLRSAIVRLVELCTRYAWTVIVLSVALSSLSAVYAVRHFAVKTDVNNLFPSNLPWAERAYSFMAAFPQHDILVVLDAPTPEQ